MAGGDARPRGVDPTRGYLLDLVTQERLPFQFNPAELSVKLGATWTDKEPRGASHPRKQFRAGKGRSYQVALRFLRTTTDASDMPERRRLVESLPFPDYDASGRISSGPHPVRFVFGAMARKCIVEDVTLDLGPWFDPTTLEPGEFLATLTLVEQPAGGDLSRSDIRGGA